MKPIFALHKDANGNVLTACSFEYEHEKSSWLRNLDLRSGDRIEIGEITMRPEADAVGTELPADIVEGPPVPELADADDDIIF